MYLTKEANAATLRQIAALAPGSTLALTFPVPVELLDEADRAGFEAAARGARAAGTPFLSFYRPDEIVELARASGFRSAEHVSTAVLNERYFSGRTDGLQMSRGEEFLVAST
jgi:O-methyltransferase involved in polyketide biosynthesis